MRLLGGTSNDGPHKADPLVWQKRPLSSLVAAYAANDTHIICELLRAFRARHVPEVLMLGVSEHSERYIGHLRDRATEATFKTDKIYILEEIPVVSPETWRAARAELESHAAEQRMERARVLQLRQLEEQAQREICSAAARCERQLGEAGASKVKLDKMRDAIVSGELLVSVDNRLTANQQKIAALRSQLEVVEAKVAELPPGVAAAFAKERAEASERFSRHDEVDGDRDELDDERRAAAALDEYGSDDYYVEM